MSERVALISGATGGIGSAIAQRLAHEGWCLTLLGRQAWRLRAVLEEAQAGEAPTPRLLTIACPVQERPAVERAVRLTVQQWGHIDLLVTAHGANPVTTPSVDLDPVRDFWGVLDVDVYGTFLLCQAVARTMLAPGGGAMVLLSSLHAFQTFPARAPYAAAKAAIVGMMRSLALEWGPLGIRVNAVAPWQVRGPRTDRFLAEATAQGVDLEELYRQQSPLRRLITPEEVADAVLFLARNPAMTGQTLVLDGGVSASMYMHPFLPTTEGVLDRP